MFDFDMLSVGFFSLFDWNVFWVMPVGMFYGMLISAIPGMSGSLAIALVMPFTFHIGVRPSSSSPRFSPAASMAAPSPPSCSTCGLAGLRGDRL